MSPFMADFVAKVFRAFRRETLIQDQAQIRNNDSKEPAPRFDCFKFLFHRARLATFATKSALLRHCQASAACPLSRVKRSCRKRRLRSEFDPGCVKTHTSAKCRKYNSPTRYRAESTQDDQTSCRAIPQRFFYALGRG